MLGPESIVSVFVDFSKITARVVREASFTVPLLQFAASQGQLTAHLASRLPRAVIVGEGGAGKSTLLKQMLAHAAIAGYAPALVQLSKLPADGPLTISMLLEQLVEYAREKLGMAQVNRAFFEALIRDGRLAIGFDALDECGSLVRRQRVRGLIVEVAREWKRCRVFVTSRPDALRDTPLSIWKPADPGKEKADGSKPGSEGPTGPKPKDDEFVGLTPRPFTRDDVTPFLSAAFPDGERLAEEVLRRTGIEALIDTPLTLTLVGLLAGKPDGLPASRTSLFERCLETVVTSWEDTKTSEPSDGLEPDERRAVLQRLGWEAQRAGGDSLDARLARLALAHLPYVGSPGRAKTVVNGLARRNLLLRAELADNGGFDVQRIRFAHPQFREYLAGAHLAAQFELDPATAPAAVASHWFDTTWLDVLRFAVTTVEDDPPQRDLLLRSALAAEDPYRDLLHRPDFLVARLLAALPAAETALVKAVVTTLERLALDESALRVDAMDALLAVSQHQSAVPAIERFARGDGLGDAFGLSQSSFDASLQALRWRLRAIEALAATRGAAAALPLLPEDPPGLPGVLETCELRARLGDRTGAYATWERLFEPQALYSDAVGPSMDKCGETERFNSWLTALLATDQATVRAAQLARARGLLAADDPVWVRLFTEATRRLAAMDADAAFAPPEVSEAVDAAVENKAHASLPAGRALVTAALHHPSLVWHVGPRVGKAVPNLAAEATNRLVAYVLAALAAPSPMHDSRVSVAVTALCDEPDDGLAVPALLELLRKLGTHDDRAFSVIDSLRQRGQVDEALAMVQPQLELPQDVDDRHPDDKAESRRRGWQLVRTLDPTRMVQTLDAMYRSGEPDPDANRLMRIWRVSGVAAGARDWFRALAQDTEHDRGRLFLHTLTTHERDTEFTDEARQALHGGVIDDGRDDEAPPPWTLGDAARAFESGLRDGRYTNERGDESQATTHRLLRLIVTIKRLSDDATALRYADTWVRHSLAGLEFPSEDATDAEATGGSEDEVVTLADRQRALAEQLRGLSDRGLHDRSWLAPAAAVARTMPPDARTDLIVWLNAQT